MSDALHLLDGGTYTEGLKTYCPMCPEERDRPLDVEHSRAWCYACWKGFGPVSAYAQYFELRPGQAARKLAAELELEPSSKDLAEGKPAAPEPDPGSERAERLLAFLGKHYDKVPASADQLGLVMSRLLGFIKDIRTDADAQLWADGVRQIFSSRYGVTVDE
jgi:hypothetical protein